MRSSIADYEVIEVPDHGDPGPGRYLCRPPQRLRLEEPVTVWELGAHGGTWQHLSDLVIRLSGAPDDGLLRLFELGPDDMTGGAYLVTECWRDGTLAAPGRALDGREKADAVATAARAVHGLHEIGVAHGAVSATAIRLTARGPALAPPPLDTPPGLAVEGRDWRQLVAVDPDLLCGEMPTRASDVWSLGATAHGAFSTRPLYPGIADDEPVTAVQRVLFTRPEVDPDLPPALQEIISACLAADPAERPATALAVAERLRAAEEEL